MIAGRHRDHPGASLRDIEPQQLVQRAAFLERAGAVHGFELEVELSADEFGERRCCNRGCARNRVRNRRSRIANPGIRPRQISHSVVPKCVSRGGQSSARGYVRWNGYLPYVIARMDEPAMTLE